MKRLLLTFLGMMILLSSHATGFETINGLKYLINTDDQTAILVADTVKYTGDIVVPEKVTLAGIDYPVVAFANRCFYECDSLTSISIPSSVTTLGNGCFEGCSSLTSIIIPSSVTSLGDNCFWDCWRLTSITIPQSITSLGNGCFSYCASLTSFTIPSSVTSLGRSCFQYCNALTQISIPSSLMSLGDACFYGCSSLTSIDIPSSITSLGWACFAGCISFTSITIPSSVASLGEACFSGCNKLESVYCYAENPPTVDKELGQSITSFLYVPAASVDKYKQAEGWKDFIAILPISGMEGDVKGKCEKPVITYADGNLHFESSTTGAEYHYTLTCNDVKSGAYSQDGSVSLAAAYNISAYTTADGYSQSDNALATLYWVKGNLQTSNINTAKMRGVLASSQDGIITISGLNNGEKVSLYDVDGKMIGEATALNGIASYAVSNTSIVIARIGTSSIKIKVN